MVSKLGGNFCYCQTVVNGSHLEKSFCNISELLLNCDYLLDLINCSSFKHVQNGVLKVHFNLSIRVLSYFQLIFVNIHFSLGIMDVSKYPYLSTFLRFPLQIIVIRSCRPV